MERIVARKYIEDWIEMNYPNALAKLSMKTDIPVSTLIQIRYGRVPKKTPNRIKLCSELGISEDTLFPEATNLNDAS